MMKSFWLLLSATVSFHVSSLCGGIIDQREVLERHSFWDNRDWEWYEANIPFFDCPDVEFTTTYYYRWELLTKHLVYGSPRDGYTFTEFIDRPFWSGTYGAISCPAGHQFYEARWLRDATIPRDFAAYWFRTKGAQPMRYGTWLLDGIWAAHLVHPDKDFLLGLLPEMKKYFAEREKVHFVPEMGLFWQNGHDDGMEFNITSRQTMDILRGGNGYRPGFNAYMWADALAIARTARLAGNVAEAEVYEKKAADIKERLQKHLWDPAREFYFPMSMKEEKDKDGHVVKKHTLTYQSGRYEGNPHGRELHSYIPWQFNLPDPGREVAWKFLMDPEYFQSPFGPTTVEQGDPMFVLKNTCCWWSGQSWPYATAQTLQAMANVLNNYPTSPVTKKNYFDLLRTYTLTHRKNGRPYLAEACHPMTGSWEGHDGMGHSNHYFHSSYCDLIITGLCGVHPLNDGTLEVAPLAPEAWAWWAMEKAPYQGREVTVFWDQDGSHYKQGKGLHVLVDGKSVAQSDTLKKLAINLAPQQTPAPAKRVNWAVNNSGSYYPLVLASYAAGGTPPAAAQDGNYWYHFLPPNRWTCTGSPHAEDWISIDFGTPRKLDTLKLYVLDDTDAQGTTPGPVRAPEKIDVECWFGEKWTAIPHAQAREPKPTGRRSNIWSFPAVETSKVRARIQHSATGQAGLTEFEAWGPLEGPITDPPAPPPSLARTAKATASFTSGYDKVEEVNDGIISLQIEPRNRWTSYASKEKQDWLQLEWPEPVSMKRADLWIFDDRGGVQRPESYVLQLWDGQAWRDVANAVHSPAKPSGGQRNTVTFDAVTTNKMRVLFTHRGGARSGLTEIEVWAD